MEELELDSGSSAKDLAEKMNQREPHQALAASINGELRDLSTPLKEGDDVHLIDFNSPEGKEVFWHTSAHVLLMF